MDRYQASGPAAPHPEVQARLKGRIDKRQHQ